MKHNLGPMTQNELLYSKPGKLVAIKYVDFDPKTFAFPFIQYGKMLKQGTHLSAPPTSPCSRTTVAHPTRRKEFKGLIIKHQLDRPAANLSAPPSRLKLLGKELGTFVGGTERRANHCSKRLPYNAACRRRRCAIVMTTSCLLYQPIALTPKVVRLRRNI